jgi:hypothetical protein
MRYTSMMRFVLLSLLLVACGRSECQDYVALMCTKGIGCDAPEGARLMNRDECEREALRVVQVQRNTEEQCRQAREFMQAMNCTQFRAFVESVSR